MSVLGEPNAFLGFVMGSSKQREEAKGNIAECIAQTSFLCPWHRPRLGILEQKEPVHAPTVSLYLLLRFQRYLE